MPGVAGMAAARAKTIRSQGVRPLPMMFIGRPRQAPQPGLLGSLLCSAPPVPRSELGAGFLKPLPPAIHTMRIRPQSPQQHPPPPVNGSQQPVRRTARVGALAILAFWLVVMGALYFAMQHFLQPQRTTVTAEGHVEIPRHRDGHFRVEGSINGVPVMFLVDTGASLVVVTDALARQAGLQGGEAITFQTANGARQGRLVAAESVTVRSLAITGLRVGVGLSGLSDNDALLGQNFLRHFDVEINRDRMVLRPRGSKPGA
jgi:aspartyl protease family protein